jgi:outer membrane protein assembly factor BamA
MKRLTLALMALCFATFSYAQPPYPIQKGNFLGGGKGKLSFSSQDYLGEKLKETNFMIRPSLGYFPADQWALGLNLNFESSKVKLDDTELGKSNELGAGLWTRYYFLPETKKTNFFGEAGFNFGGAKEDDDDRISYNSYNLGLSMAHFINGHIALELGLDYSSKKYEDEDERLNRFGLCAGFQMHFDPCNKKKNTTIRPTF